MALWLPFARPLIEHEGEMQKWFVILDDVYIALDMPALLYAPIAIQK